MDQDQLQRIGRVARAYYMQTEPEPRHFPDWMNSLEEPMKSVFRGKSFDECRDALHFRRFVAEINKEDMEEYMREHLSPEDYKAWQQGK